MAEPLVRMLDAVHIDDQRRNIEFRFVDADGKPQPVPIHFEYIQALAAVFQQAFMSATMTEQQGGNHPFGQEFLSVPRADVDLPISVGVDVMTNRIVAMFLLGSPFQLSYSMPPTIARRLSDDLLSACEEIDEAPPTPKMN